MSTTILSFDPAIDLTGFAVLKDDGSPEGKLLEFGLIRNKDADNLGVRGGTLAAEVKELVRSFTPQHIPIELPAATGRAWGGYKNRSVLSVPVYGFAVGIVWASIPEGFEAGRVGIPADEWSLRYPAGDKNKNLRVRSAALLYGLEEKRFGAKTVAGNVADAVLIARYFLLRHVRVDARLIPA